MLSRSTSILRPRMAKSCKIKKTRRNRRVSLPATTAKAVPSAAARVFNTPELAEMIFIHLPLKALCLAMQINRTAYQIINNPSAKQMRENRYLDAVLDDTDTLLDPEGEEICFPPRGDWITFHPFLDPYFDNEGLFRIKALAEDFVPESIQEQLIVQPLRPVMFFYSHDPVDWRSGYGSAEMIIHDKNGGKIKKLVEHAKKHVEMRGDAADDAVLLYFDPPWLALDGEVRPETDTEEWLAKAVYI